MISIKDIKNGEVFFGLCSDGKFKDFKAWQDPWCELGVWKVECTDAGDYVFIFDETDQDVLFKAQYKEVKLRGGTIYMKPFPPESEQ